MLQAADGRKPHNCAAAPCQAAGCWGGGDDKRSSCLSTWRLACCRLLHNIHHKYNKEHTLSPFAGLAFHPLDGIIQVRLQGRPSNTWLLPPCLAFHCLLGSIIEIALQAGLASLSFVRGQTDGP